MDRLLLQHQQAAMPAATHYQQHRITTGWNVPVARSKVSYSLDGVSMPRCQCTSRRRRRLAVCSAATAMQSQMLPSSDTEFKEGQQQAAREEASSSSNMGSSHMTATPQQQGETSETLAELDEKEKLRRSRISAANTGKMPWNFGRKHSPETIAKIRERTRAAMLRPEVYQAYKEGVTKHLAEKAKLNPKPEKPPKPPKEPKAPRVRKKKATVQTEATEGDQQTGAADSTQGDAAAAPKRRRSSSKPKAAASDAGQGEASAPADPAAPKAPRKRAPTSEEHKAAIRAAIRAKWQDPEYRAKAVGGMHERIRQAKGIEPRTSRSSLQRQAAVANRAKRAAQGSSATTATSGTSNSSTTTATTSSTTKKRSRKASAKEASQAELQARKEWLVQVQARVKAVIDMRYNIERLKVKMEQVRLEASGAFANDTPMKKRTYSSLTDCEQLLALALHKLRELESQIPEGVAIRQGKVEGNWEAVIVDPEKLFDAMPQAAAAAAAAPATTLVSPAAAVVDSEHVEPAADAGVDSRRGVPAADPAVAAPAAATEGLSQLDPPVMQSPLHAMPEMAHGPANGKANGVHVNGHGHAKVNGTHRAHVNGHATHAASSEAGPQLVDPMSAEQLLASSGTSPTDTATSKLLPQQLVAAGQEATAIVVDMVVEDSAPKKPKKATGTKTRTANSKTSSSSSSTAVVASNATQLPAADDGDFVRSTKASRRRPS